ncbi:MAG: ArsR family transcriptional regulator [Acidilobaceae archaeon]|nr:ArsR family transcriptional regulator [Acidilobaceae archaeon]MCX8165821.1 ArsR family transcriptional regulator [Acidilobaceae archaeon]MDW7974245.1 ArsR family transcriptional regulator [Sulfolobales archaeon]
MEQRDLELLDLLEKEGPSTISTLAYKLGIAKSSVSRKVRLLKDMGLVEMKRIGGITLVYRIAGKQPPGTIRIGLLRASEYPYVIDFARRLRDRYSRVELIVYDEAFRLGIDLASNKVQLAFAPVPTLLLAHRISAGRTSIIGGGSGGGAHVIEGREGFGHATTMASSMELCAEMMRLEGPRIYKRSGKEILDAVKRGETRQGVVWEPYGYLARKEGLRAEACDLPLCCLLGAHEGVEGLDHIARALSESISASRRSSDFRSYAALVGLEESVIRETTSSYVFYEEVPLEVLKRLWPHVKSSLLPEDAINRAVRSSPTSG